MASKLEYLKKYLAKPGQEPSLGGTHSVDGDRVRAVKEKKSKKKLHEQAPLQIRDLSEALPKPRAASNTSLLRGGGRRGDLGLGARMAAEPDEDFVFVDEQEVEEKSKIDVETSGVAWNISQHRRAKLVGTRGAAATTAAVAAAAAAVPSSGNAAPSSGSRATVKEEGSKLGSDDDLSPPRRGRAEASAQGSRGRAHEDNASDDLSPPRQSGSGKAASSPVKPEPEDSDEDLSPPRPRLGSGKAASSAVKPEPEDSDGDLSPPRPAKPALATRAEPDGADSDLSPPRGGGGRGEAGRKRHDSDSDLSPPRQGGGGGVKSAASSEEPERMSSGLRAGLVRGSDLKDEAAQVRAERRAAVMTAPDDQTGRGAATVYRNREGARVTREEWVEQQKKKRRKKMSDYPEQELEWGGGVKQKYSKEAEMAEVERIAAQPFARYEPDEKYMEELKERQDWNDPMRKFQEEEEEKAQGAAAGAAPRVSKPKCPHAPWPNRFNIPPGYRWDGKVRGTDFEKRWLETKNHREFKDKERWKYEMEEM